MCGANSADFHRSWSFLLTYLSWNVSLCFYLCFGRQLRWFWGKRMLNKYFLMWQWSFESVPEISLPPCIWRRQCRKIFTSFFYMYQMPFLLDALKVIRTEYNIICEPNKQGFDTNHSWLTALSSDAYCYWRVIAIVKPPRNHTHI